MEKYKIEISGKGGEYYTYPITEEQKDSLNNSIVSESQEDMCSVLGVDDIISSDNTFVGPYFDSELFSISVYNQNGEVVWESPEDFYFENDGEYIIECSSNHFIVEDYVKGTFYSYEIECDEFDSSKLEPIVTSLADDRFEILSGLIYDGKDLSETKEYVGYWSKGFSYYTV